jgi:predicted dehydrogenase/threonine dehydrogenase-like Zn-dependent dehydrogenase
VKQVFLVDGTVRVEDVPAPVPAPGEVLVRTRASLISAGTEMAAVTSSAPRSAVKRALLDPRLVLKALRMMRSKGFGETLRVAQGRTGFPLALGYSVAGTVEEAGRGVNDLSPGRRVACAGQGFASHAEFVAVPRNLVVPIPDGLDDERAAFVTLGAIALQGVRRLGPELGEVVPVVGLGLLGLLTVQLLSAAGCRVIGIELVEARRERARRLGAAAAVPPDQALRTVMDATEGQGADAVSVTAASKSAEPLDLAIRMCRKRARVVVVGDVPLTLQRGEFYRKELDLRIATSYGPGRYDAGYEIHGRDYPLPYVRWTENRNLGEVLRLAAEGRLDVGALVDARLPVGRADEAFSLLAAEDPERRPVGVVLTYPASPPPSPAHAGGQRLVRATVSGPVRVCVVGAGSFSQSTHLPNLKARADVRVACLVAHGGAKAKAVAERFQVPSHSTSFEEAFASGACDAAVVATRHDSHPEIAMAAARHGLHALVEKPLALETERAIEVERAFLGAGRVLAVGFNRRFAPLLVRLRERLRAAEGPTALLVRVNSAEMANPQSWLHDPIWGGGVLRGEGVHFLDLVRWILGEDPVSIQATGHGMRYGDATDHAAIALLLSFPSGSVANLTYTTLGHSALGKERIEAFRGGTAIAMDDYRTLVVEGPSPLRETAESADKGHAGLLDRFVNVVRGSAEPGDLPLGRDGAWATMLAEAALESARTGRAVVLPRAPHAIRAEEAGETGARAEADDLDAEVGTRDDATRSG